MSTKPAELCHWFALCDHLATRTRPHPILGDVAICERCDLWTFGLEESTR